MTTGYFGDAFLLNMERVMALIMSFATYCMAYSNCIRSLNQDG